MRNAKHDDLVAQQTRESIAIRMQSFGDEFERLASTATQSALATRFNDSAQEVVRVPLTAAELQPLGEWLNGNRVQFEMVAKTTDQKQLVASFKEFIAEIDSTAVKAVFQRPLVNELVEEIELATGGRPQ